MKFLDLDREYVYFDWKNALEQVFVDKCFIDGPPVAKFEKEVAEYLGVKHAIGVTSGTDALQVAFMALDIAGKTVLTTPYTFIATTEMPIRLGAKVIFCDIDETFNMDLSKAKEIIKNRHIDVLLLVHLFGLACLDQELLDLCKEKNVTIVEDCAQAFGTKWRDKQQDDFKSVGSIGEIGCFSFFPAKNLGCAGDAGLITTNSTELYEKCIQIKKHGSKQKYIHEVHGGNFRMDTVQAALLSEKLPLVDDWIERRRYAGIAYSMSLSDFPIVCPNIQFPMVRHHSFNQYVIQVEDNVRNVLVDYLKKRGIPTAIYYPRCLSEQPCYSGIDFECDCSVSKKMTKRNIALPVAHLEEAEIQMVVNTIRGYYV